MVGQIGAGGGLILLKLLLMQKFASPFQGLCHNSQTLPTMNYFIALNILTLFWGAKTIKGLY